MIFWKSKRRIAELERRIIQEMRECERLREAQLLATSRNDPEFVRRLDGEIAERQGWITECKRNIILEECDASLIDRSW